MFSMPILLTQSERHRKLVMLINAVATNELHTHHLYSQLLGSGSDLPSTLSKLFHTALDEDKDHFHAMATCIQRLNGNPAALRTHNHQSTLPHISKVHIEDLLQTLIEKEGALVNAYSEICNITLEYDYYVFDLSYRNLHGNMSHLNIVTELLNDINYPTSTLTP